MGVEKAEEGPSAVGTDTGCREYAVGGTGKVGKES